MSKKYFLNVCIGLFAAVSLAHLGRAVARWPWTVGSYSIPLWVSWVAAAVTLALAIWARRLHRG